MNEKSKTCPECRQKVVESKVSKIYLHYASNDSILEITSSLQAEIAGLNHELLIKEIEIIESNSNNTKLSTLLKSKESELRRLEADLWIAREHNSLWKNHAQVEMAEHNVAKKEVSRLTKELNDMKSSQTVAEECWNKISNMFRGIGDHETILKMIADSQSELMSNTTSRYDFERSVERLEEEIEIELDSANRILSTEQLSRKRQLEQDLACSEIEKIALRQRIKELEEKVEESVEITDERLADRNEPLRKKLKVSAVSFDVIDLTKEPVDALVDLTEDDDVII
ncbi:uncharacterized protein [Venturia canescens]|uniref:uncharacterized protein isoform X2 n=1 Tax=Venturia canescens TaxID=32260 RepID=UPI001C9C9AE3|nr:uncharacterized protein LOC122411156 isoform X2 [Venturia canescens]